MFISTVKLTFSMNSYSLSSIESFIMTAFVDFKTYGICKRKTDTVDDTSF